MRALSILALERPGLVAAPTGLRKVTTSKVLAMRHAAHTIDANNLGNFLQPSRQC